MDGSKMQKDSKHIKILDIYEDILQGNRKRFPRGTWTPQSYGKENFKKCLRYVVEKCGYTRIDITHINTDFFIKNKLRAALEVTYPYSISDAIIDTFPEYDFKKWEFFGISKDENLAIEALQELTKRNKWNRNDFLEDRSRFYQDKDTARILDWAFKHNYKIIDLIQMALPQFNFTKEELKLKTNRDKHKERIREVFTNELKWSKEDIENKFTRSIAKQYFGNEYKIFRNLLTIAQCAYPNITHLKSAKIQIPDKIKKQVAIDIKKGLSTKRILNKYGISRSSLMRLRKNTSDN